MFSGWIFDTCPIFYVMWLWTWKKILMLASRFIIFWSQSHSMLLVCLLQMSVFFIDFSDILRVGRYWWVMHSVCHLSHSKVTITLKVGNSSKFSNQEWGVDHHSCMWLIFVFCTSLVYSCGRMFVLQYCREERSVCMDWGTWWRGFVSRRVQYVHITQPSLLTGLYCCLTCSLRCQLTSACRLALCESFLVKWYVQQVTAV